MLGFSAISEHAISQAPPVLTRAAAMIAVTSGMIAATSVRVQIGEAEMVVESGELFGPRWTLIPEAPNGWTLIPE